MGRGSEPVGGSGSLRVQDSSLTGATGEGGGQLGQQRAAREEKGKADAAGCDAMRG